MRSPRLAGTIRRRFAVAMTLALAAACGGGGDGVTQPAVVPVGSVSLQVANTAMIIGASQQVFATVRDASGAVLSGRSMAWTSSNAGVASLSGTTGATLVVTALSVGATTITVTSEGRSASVELAVTPVPVATVVVTPASATLGRNGSGQLTATALDPNGVALAGRAVAWASSATGVATVSGTGLVTAVAPGTATITATVEGKSATSAITVSSAPAPTITTVGPSLLLSGGTATISGANFGPALADNTVTIDGVPAAVIAASPTELTVQAATLPCAPSHSAQVAVTVGGLTATGAVPVRAGTPVTVATGATLLLSPADARCAELPAGAGRFVVGVVSTIQTPTAITGFRFQSSNAIPVPTAADASVTAATPAPIVMRATRGGTMLPPRAPAPLVQPVDDETLHQRILESNVAVLTRLRTARRHGAAPSAASRALVPGGSRRAAVPAVNDVRTFRVRTFNLTLGGSSTCAGYTEITARAVYVGTRSVVYEDTTAKLARTMDPYYARIGQEMDADMYDVVSTNFGDPLVTDSLTDGDGHLSMVFSPAIPSGVAGFVSGCDFGPRDSTSNRSSNFGEYFYAVVPTVAGAGFSGNTADSWLRNMRHTIVHEVKHIASFGARFVNDASVFEESWLEEGTARHAEELWLRAKIYGKPWKGAITYDESGYCDVRPTFSTCTGAPFGILNHFAGLYDALAQPGEFSLFGRVADGDFRYYAASWSFVRWAIDRHATTEAAFLRGLTQSRTLSGVANVTAQTGRSADDMLVAWMLALYLDDAPAFASNADTQIPTWNMHDIFRRMSQDFPQSFVREYPLVPTDVPTGSFVHDHGGIHGGSFSMYLLTGAPGTPLALRLGARGTASGAAPDGLRVAIARLP